MSPVLGSIEDIGTSIGNIGSLLVSIGALTGSIGAIKILFWGTIGPRGGYKGHPAPAVGLYRGYRAPGGGSQPPPAGL